ncbi:hypothetical protein FOL47_010414, partial [Perkinsus chesapeaki]
MSVDLGASSRRSLSVLGEAIVPSIQQGLTPSAVDRVTLGFESEQKDAKNTSEVKWEDQASYYAYYDRCDLGTTETTKLMINYGQYAIILHATSSPTTIAATTATTTVTTTLPSTNPGGFSGEFRSSLPENYSSMFAIGDNTNVFCNPRCQRARYERILSEWHLLQDCSVVERGVPPLTKKAFSSLHAASVVGGITSTIQTGAGEVKWEDQASYYAYYDR